jgi:hypothetical protein
MFVACARLGVSLLILLFVMLYFTPYFGSNSSLRRAVMKSAIPATSDPAPSVLCKQNRRRAAPHPVISSRKTETVSQFVFRELGQKRTTLSNEALNYAKWQTVFQELALSKDHYDERQAIDDALATVRVLKKDKLSHPDWM